MGVHGPRARGVWWNTPWRVTLWAVKGELRVDRYGPGAKIAEIVGKAPGAVKALLVEFRPDQVGPQAGALTIVRDDGAQSGLEVALAGEGAAPARHGPFRH